MLAAAALPGSAGGLDSNCALVHGADCSPARLGPTILASCNTKALTRDLDCDRAGLGVRRGFEESRVSRPRRRPARRSSRSVVGAHALEPAAAAAEGGGGWDPPHPGMAVETLLMTAPEERGGGSSLSLPRSGSADDGS